PMSQTSDAPKPVMQRILDVVERVGNKVPHPVCIFLTLIIIVVVLSHVFYLLGTSVSTEVIVAETSPTPEKSLDSYPYAAELSAPHKTEIRTTKVRSLL